MIARLRTVPLGLVLAVVATLAVKVEERPVNPVNLTVIGLRPANLSANVVNKNTANVAGDLFFWITDRLVAPFACRISNGSWWACHEQGTLDHNSVYTKTVLEVDATQLRTDYINTSLGHCVVNNTIGPVQGPPCYASCNPRDRAGLDWGCGCAGTRDSNDSHHPPCDIVGVAWLSLRYTSCADGCHYINDHWKPLMAQHLGGLWYSTPAEAHCGDPDQVSCRWRELAKVKTVNASCANGNVIALVRRKGAACYASCPEEQRAIDTSDCAVRCFFQTVLGKSKFFPAGGKGIAVAEMVSAFDAAFDSDDPLTGGCPEIRS